MTNSDAAYYTARARQERDRADQCSDPALARVHREFADRYESRVATARGPSRQVA